MIKNIKNISILVLICVVITFLLAVTNLITAPIIENNLNASANAALLEVMPEGEGFDSVNITEYQLPDTVTEIYKEDADKGYVIKLVTSGYSSDMVIMCGVSADGKITGAACLSSNETLGKEKTYGESFTDKDAEGVDSVDTVAGATKTTNAYKNVVKDALNTVIILSGGSVDIRTDEEILYDNLSAALPEGDRFAKLFLTEITEGIDAIYETENQTGFVCVVGEHFIGVDTEGKIITEGVEAPEKITDAIARVKSSVLTEIDLTPYAELTSYLLSAKISATGNYVFETKGAGYGIKGGNEYHPASGEYITVRVSMTPEGKIIDCITLSQAETDGLGSACADESFYGQFDGKTESDYTEIDAISGATITTDGYKQAIGRAFEALNILKGGN